MSRDPRKLHAYQRAHSLTVAVYHATAKLPKSEQFGLQSQLRRAAVSVVANVAEGAARPHAADYARFLGIALGSAVELRCLVDLVVDLGLASAEDLADCRERSDHVVRTLQKLHGWSARSGTNSGAAPGPGFGLAKRLRIGVPVA